MSRTDEPGKKTNALSRITVRLAYGCIVAYQSDDNIMPRVGELVWCYTRKRNEAVRKARRAG